LNHYAVLVLVLDIRISTYVVHQPLDIVTRHY